MIPMFSLRQSIVAIFLILPSLALADAKTFDKAVNEYLKGFRACSDANTLRSTNIIEANKKFMYYKQQLDLAVSIDETILTSTERDMNRNLDYCQRVEDNLTRAEATPILQHAFTYCEASRSSYEKAQYEQARAEFEEYRRYKDEAYAITASIDDVFVLASQVRSCGRFEEKLAKKEQEAEKQKQQVTEVIALYEKFKQECDSTLAYVQRPNFLISQLPKANQMLNTATKSKKAALAMKGAISYAAAHPEAEQSIQLVSIQESSRICEGAVKEKIRAKAKEMRALKSFIAVKNNNLKESLKACESAQKAADLEDLKTATATYQLSSSQKKKATSSKTVKLVKGFPGWDESKAYNGLLKQTKDCQDRVSKTIKQVKEEQEKAKQAAAEKAKAAAQEEAPKPEPQSEPLAEEKPSDISQAKEEIKEASQTEPETKAEEEADPVEKQQPTQKATESESTPSTDAPDDPENWDDVELEEETLEDDSSDQNKRKSWTDLVN